jgi:uncharacterized protein
MTLQETIAAELGLPSKQVANTLALLDEGNTVPFIARYRKEVTGNLDEVQIRAIEDRARYLRTLEERRETVLNSIREQGKLTPDLEARILAATRLQEVEDLYLPYRPKRRTRATVARERGLAPLADEMLSQQIEEGSLAELAAKYVDPEKDLHTVEDVLSGARDIVAETVSDDADVRQLVRQATLKKGSLVCQARDPENLSEYANYADYSEPLGNIPAHRILAINRGEREGYLKVEIEAPVDEIVAGIEKRYVVNPTSLFADQVREAIRDAYRRLIAPAIEREIRNSLTEKAEDHAIQVFATNLRQLLMAPPVRDKVIMGIDPGYRTGCKVAVIDPTGRYLEGSTIYPHEPQGQWQKAKAEVARLINKHGVEIVAIGNGTASRETEALVAEVIHELDGERQVVYTIVNEAGASVYSASDLAREEFPELDAAMRGNISIARRVLDPLSELVKIDPKSIGVGLYQHDVNQARLGEALDRVVESCVNAVGVDLNTASKALLRYVAGISSRLAENIVAYRNEHGSFRSRAELLQVKGMGKMTFTQAAGFLRIPDAELFLDRTAVHPESYSAAEKLLEVLGLSLAEVGRGGNGLRERIQELGKSTAELAAECGVGVPTLEDIIASIEKPNRDPRDEMPKPIFRTDVLSMEDLRPGMILKGTVRNVVDFGAFVDIGVKEDGLVHISRMAKKYVRNPFDVVSVGDVIEVKVLNVDVERGRIGLSMVLDES